MRDPLAARAGEEQRAGAAAAISAKKAGAEVHLFEKTDLILGLGNVGGIMRNNGRYTACEEAMCLGARELFTITDENATHKNMNFPGHNHATIYNVLKIEPPVRKLIKDMGIEVRIMSRVVDVDCEDNILKAVILEDGQEIYRTWEDDSDETVEIYHSNSDNVLIEMSNGDCVKYDIYDIIKKRYSYPEKVALYSNTIVNIKEDI